VRIPSPALVISVIALFIALGGTSYAVTQLPKDSVGTKQLKKSAVTSQKLKAGAVTSRTIAKGAVTDGKLAGNAVTGAKVKDGSLTADDLTAAARAELRGTPLTSAAASGSALLPMTADAETEVLSTTITVAYPARLLLDGFVSAGHFASSGTTDEWVPVQCWPTVNGTRAGGTSAGGVLDGVLAFSSLTDVSLPISGSAEVAAGTHTVSVRCLAGASAAGSFYEVSSRELTIAAFGR